MVSANEKRQRNRAMVAYHMADWRRTLQQIGDHFGVTRERVRQILEKHGIKSSRTDVERNAAIIAFYKADPSNTMMMTAQHFGLPRTVVQSVLRKYGVMGNTRVTDDMKDEIVVYYQSGHGLHTTAAHCEVGYATVYRTLKDRGIPRHPVGHRMRR